MRQSLLPSDRARMHETSQSAAAEYDEQQTLDTTGSHAYLEFIQQRLQEEQEILRRRNIENAVRPFPMLLLETGREPSAAALQVLREYLNAYSVPLLSDAFQHYVDRFLANDIDTACDEIHAVCFICTC